MFVARTGSDLTGLEGLKAARLALGSQDSAQAAILPLYSLRQAGLAGTRPGAAALRPDVGKHGDTGRSELDALRALARTRRPTRLPSRHPRHWETIGRESSMPGAFEAFWESPTYSHCNFTAMPSLSDDRAQPWVDHLLAMDFDNPKHRTILEMEGLRRVGVLPQMDGYASLFKAVD